MIFRNIKSIWYRKCFIEYLYDDDDDECKMINRYHLKKEKNLKANAYLLVYFAIHA